MSKNRYPVGIDLGTTFSSISYVDEQGRVETIRLEGGKFSMASAVYFESAADILVGNEALAYALIDAPRTARAFKRHMGDPAWSFQVDDKTYRAEELSAMVLKKLVAEASRTIGPIEQAVISVPFMFDEPRRRATKHAGRIAGIDVLDIIDEPVAGAIAYGHTLMRSGGSNIGDVPDEIFPEDRILVYDLGGGTFDLTLMQLISDCAFKVLATDGDHALGGEDWDAALVDHLKGEYRAKFGVDPKDDKELLQELRMKAEEAKQSLSKLPSVSVELVRGEKVESVAISRDDFEAMTEHLVDRTRATMESMVDRANVSYDYIDFILLIGGSSRMPMVRKMLEQETKREFKESLSPDTAVSQGAALFAAYRTGDRSMRNIEIETVNPHPLGLLVYSNRQRMQVNDVLLKANKPTETEVTKIYPVKKGAAGVSLVVLQGELSDPSDCIKLGEVRLPSVSADLLAGAKVNVTFCFLQNGLLQVRGTLHPAGDRPPLEVDFEIEVEGSMSEEEVCEAMSELEEITIE